MHTVKIPLRPAHTFVAGCVTVPVRSRTDNVLLTARAGDVQWGSQRVVDAHTVSISRSGATIKGHEYAKLHIGFHVLGAETMRSEALTTNTPSIRVSERCGYQRDGSDVTYSEGYVDRRVRFLMTREQWLNTPRPHVHATGEDELKRWFDYRNHHSLRKPSKPTVKP